MGDFLFTLKLFLCKFLNMIDETSILQIIHNFEENPLYKFGLKEFKFFVGPENQNMLYIVLFLQEYRFQHKSFQTIISDIKSRLLKLLNMDRIILNCDIDTELF